MHGLLLLRHAQSTWNAARRWQGWADPPLSEEGMQQVAVAAERLAEEEPFDLVVTSDLLRARHTADLLLAALGSAAERAVEPGLREHDVAGWSGLGFAEVEARWPGDVDRMRRGEQPLGGGEPRGVFDARVAAAGRRTAAAAAVRGARRLLVIAHGGVLNSLARSAGRAEHRVGHLAGYRGRHGDGGLVPLLPVDLLEPLTAREPA